MSARPPEPEVPADGWTYDGGWLRASALAEAGVAHGVSTRALGDMKDRVLRDGALKAAGFDPAAAASVRQVHGDRVVTVAARADAEGQEADALVTRTEGLPLLIYVADCMPVFAYDPERKALGLAHVGWRGARAGAARRMAEAMVERFGSDPKGLVCAVGPHVGPCCFAVSPETAAFFPRARLERDGKPFVDLGREAVLQLGDAGVPEGRVALSRACTASDPRRFFSFRRDKGDARMLAVAALQ